MNNVPAVARLVVYGDFNCPWSYLAFRRTEVLAEAGVQVDWRAIEHAPWTPSGRDDRSARFTELREEMDRVVAMLLPGERLPYDLAGFVPLTDAAVAAYAEAVVAGVPERVRRLLFEAFWMHGIDIGDARVLRTLLVDDLRSTPSPSEVVRDWGHPVGLNRGPVSTAAWRLIGGWAAEWRDTGKQVVPVVQPPAALPIHGVDAVQWLGDQITARGLTPQPPTAGVAEPAERTDRGELPALGWASVNGGQWLRRWQRAATVSPTASR